MLALSVESWIWYSVVTLVVITRFISRWFLFRSLKRFQAEDYIMVVVFAFYTVLVSVINIVVHLDSNLILPQDIPNLTPESTKSRIRGSKLVLVVEQSMIMTIWGCKISLLLLYNRLTFGFTQQIAVKIVGCYVVVNLVVMEILYFGVWCRPFDQYWAVPVPNEQCSAAVHHLITNAVFNISSDLMMLCIPLPLLITSQLPRTKKLILCVLFSLGVFVILCAVLNKYYSFAHPFSPMWTFWYVREASTALLVANIPMCWSLVRRLFNLASFNDSSTNTGSKSKSFPLTSGKKVTSRSHKGGRSHMEDGMMKGEEATWRSERSSKGGGGSESWWDREAGLGRSESEESIIGRSVRNGGEDRKGVASPLTVPLEVWETKEVNIDRGSVRIRPGELRDVGGLIGPAEGNDRMYDGSGKGGYESRTVVTAISSRGEGRSSESSR